MTNYSKTYRNRIVEAYNEIKDTSHESVISFYEQNRSDIRLLSEDDQFEMLARYCKALFLTSAYRKHIHAADILIERSIMDNVQYLHGVDIYKESLFDKAASLYNLGKIGEATRILESLSRMGENHKAHRYLLQKCYLHHKPKFVQIARALCVLLTLFSAFIIGIELLFVRPLAPQFQELVVLSRNVLFITGIGFFAISELIHRTDCYVRSINVT